MKKRAPITESLRRHIAEYGIMSSPEMLYAEEMLREIEEAAGKPLSRFSTGEWKAICKVQLMTLFSSYKTAAEVKCALNRTLKSLSAGRKKGPEKLSADAAASDMRIKNKIEAVLRQAPPHQRILNRELAEEIFKDQASLKLRRPLTLKTITRKVNSFSPPVRAKIRRT